MGLPFVIGCTDPRSQKRDPPNFLYVVLDRTACAPFYTERRIECAKPTKLRRKSGTWGTRRVFPQLESGWAEPRVPPRHAGTGPTARRDRVGFAPNRVWDYLARADSSLSLEMTARLSGK